MPSASNAVGGSGAALDAAPATSVLTSATACVLPAAEVLRQLDSDANAGLSTGEWRARLRRHGANELSAEEEEPVWRKFLDKLREPMIVLLLASAAVSLLTRQFDDAVSITLAVVIVMSVATIQEYKSDQSLAALSKLAPHTCHVTRDGRVAVAEASELVPGDIVQVSGGDRIPADMRLLDSHALYIDESSLTGENEPAAKDARAIALPTAGAPNAIAATVVPTADRHCIGYMGTLVRSGRCDARAGAQRCPAAVPTS